MGANFALKMVTEDGLLCLDLCLPDRRLAVEVYDEGHFCVNQQQPLGDTVLRIQLLAACGWQVRD